MKAQVIRKIFNGFIYIHILYHANKEPFYGSWMIEELKGHGYSVSPGTLYPILKTMVEEGLMYRVDINVNGKIRKYYKITTDGKETLEELQGKLRELIKEVPLGDNY